MITIDFVDFYAWWEEPIHAFISWIVSYKLSYLIYTSDNVILNGKKWILSATKFVSTSSIWLVFFT